MSGRQDILIGVTHTLSYFKFRYCLEAGAPGCSAKVLTVKAGHLSGIYRYRPRHYLSSVAVSDKSGFGTAPAYEWPKQKRPENRPFFKSRG